MGPGYVDLYVQSASGERRAVELSPLAATATWSLVVETDLPNTPVTVAAPDLSGVPRELSVVLVDEAAGRAVNLRTSTGYGFTSGEQGESRSLQLRIAPAGPAAALVTALALAPTPTGLEVAYTVGTPGEVDIEVRNIAGRLVAAIPCGTQAIGAHTAVWSGVSVTGTRAPAGRYIVTVRCRAEDGTEARRMATAVLR